MYELWVSGDETARHLGVAKDTVCRSIETRGFPAHRLGHLWKLKVSEVDDWVRRGADAFGDRSRKGKS